MITKIFNIDDFRIEVKAHDHGIRFGGDTTCPHKRLFFDENGQTVECQDCKKQVTAWWALFAMADGLKRMRERLEADQKMLDEEKAKNVTHKAALKVETAWRRRNYIPTCPHDGCRKPILPPDGFGGGGVNKEFYGANALPMEMKPVLGIVGKEEVE